jgi:hypothetical protein
MLFATVFFANFLNQRRTESEKNIFYFFVVDTIFVLSFMHVVDVE